MLDFHQHFIDRLAFANSFVSGVALYPQAWAVLSTGSAAGLSATTFFLVFLNSVVWVLYAIHRDLLSLLIASLLNAFASGILVISIATV